MAFRTLRLSFTTLIMVLFLGVVRTNQDSPLLEETISVASTPKPTPPEQDENLLLNTDLPIFLTEPQNSFVVKNRVATLHCRAAHSLRVYFKCNGARKVETTEFEFVDPQNGVRIMEAETNVTRDMVEEFFGKEKFKCECFAWNGKGSIKSQPATVEVACVVLETKDDCYKVGTDNRILKQLYCGSKLTVCTEKLVTTDSVKQKDISLRQSQKAGQSYTRCYCNQKCKRNICKCQAKSHLCNPKCRKSIECCS